MSKRWWSYAVWAVVAAVALWWSSRLFVGERRTEPVPTAVAGGAPAEPQRLFDQNPASAPPAVATADPVPGGRFELVKVDGREREAVAVIGVDGLPPKAYRVGDTVVGAVVLQSVQPRSAALGPANGPPAVFLQLSSPAASPGASPPPDGAAGSRRAQADSQPPIRAASAPPVNRSAVPVSDPDHGVDTSNR